MYSEKRFRDVGLQKINIQEGEKVLEIGFSTGYCILSLTRLVGDTGKTYGFDILFVKNIYYVIMIYQN